MAVMEDFPKDLSYDSYGWDIICEIDKLLEDYKSDTEDSNAVNYPNDLVPLSTANILTHSPAEQNEVEFVGKNKAVFELLEDNEKYGVYEYNPNECNWNVFYKTLPLGENLQKIKQESGIETINGYSAENQQINVKLEIDIGESNDQSQTFNNTNQYLSVTKENIPNLEHSVVNDEIMLNLWKTPLFSNQISTCPPNLNPESLKISKPENHEDKNVKLKHSYSDKGLTFNTLNPTYLQNFNFENYNKDKNIVLQTPLSDKSSSSAVYFNTNYSKAENYKKDKDILWKTSTSRSIPNSEHYGNYNHRDDYVVRDTKTNSKFINWKQYYQKYNSSFSRQRPSKNYKNNHRKSFKERQTGPLRGNKNKKNNSRKQIQNNVTNSQRLPSNQLRGFNSKSNETNIIDFNKIPGNNPFENHITFKKIEKDKKNLNTRTNISKDSLFIPESIPDRAFNNFQPQHLSFATTNNKPSYTSTEHMHRLGHVFNPTDINIQVQNKQVINNLSLWHEYTKKNEMQNLNTGKNNPTNSQFIPESIPDRAFNNFQPQHLPFATTNNKPSHTLTGNILRPSPVFNSINTNKQVTSNSSLWHEHKNTQNLYRGTNSSNSSQFIPASILDCAFSNFQQPNLLFTSMSDMYKPMQVFDPIDFTKQKQHNEGVNTLWNAHKNANNSQKQIDLSKQLFQGDASKNYITGPQNNCQDQSYMESFTFKLPQKTKEVMAPQEIDQKAMCVNADDSSSKEISHDKYNIIKDYLSPETLVGCTLKFSSRKLVNTATRENIENILSIHGPLVNSWWTPDDLYFITYKTRSIAQYVFNLYPKNTTNSY